MKIGVFGDSFADKNSQKIWWKYLETIHGHDVTSFGECESSLLFSADLIHQHGSDFDKIIWCPTSVNRVSFFHKGKNHHTTGFNLKQSDDFELEEKYRICHEFIKKIFDWQPYEIAGSALVDNFLQRFPNLSVLPSFATPTYFSKPPGFNLYDLCQQETEHYFPGMTVAEVYAKYQDLRHGHLTEATQVQLSMLINENLDSKIFNFGYDLFAKPTAEFNNLFIRLS